MATMTTNHTPTPWRLLPATAPGSRRIEGANKHTITTMDGDMDHIVTCVNAHDALTARVAELEAALNAILDETRIGTGIRRSYAAIDMIAHAALAKDRP
jgi:hypothetical protein